MKRLNGRMDRGRYGYLFALPLMCIICIVILYPIVRIAIMSFQSWYMVRPVNNGKFVGFKNYLELFSDKYFSNSVRVTFLYLVVTVPFRFLLGFGSALLLNQRFRGRALARSLIIIPWAVPEVITCLIWILMYNKEFGIINAMFRSLGFITDNLGYLTNSNVALQAAMVVNIWKGYPFCAVMLLAGMQSIPHEMYEAARVDGANAFNQLKSITIPMLSPVSMVVFMLLFVWTMRDFAIVYILAGGGPAHATEVLPIYLYKQAFTSRDYGIAAAGGVFMMVVALVFIALYIRALEKDGTQI